MAVKVVVRRGVPNSPLKDVVEEYPDGVDVRYVGDRLEVVGAGDDNVLAMYAPGKWESASKG